MARLLLVLLAGVTPVARAGAQETLLERTTIGLVADGWAPRWGGAWEPINRADGSLARVSFWGRTEALRLRGSFRQRESTAAILVRQPLTPLFTLRVGVAADAWGIRSGGRDLVDARPSEAVSTGLEVGQSLGRLGAMRLVALAGWDRGAGGEGRLGLEGRRYGLDARAWRVHARESRVHFPADSLRDVGVAQLATGVRAAGHVEIPAGRLSFRAAAAWARESLDTGTEPPAGFLQAAPTGEADFLRLSVAAAAGPWELKVERQTRDVGLESVIERSGLSAGRLFYADLALSRWTTALTRRAGAAAWSLVAGREEVGGQLSTRVETWPFLDLWGTLSVQAYRLGGRLDAGAKWLGIRREPEGASGWTWGVSAGEYELAVDRLSWFVTSFGFGRTGREDTRSGVESAVVVGVELGHSRSIGSSRVRLRGEVGGPIRARALAGATGSGGAPAEGLSGYGSFSLAWFW